MIPLGLAVLSHVLTDFVFQSDIIVENKNELRLKGLFLHWLTTYIVMIIFLIPYELSVIVQFALVVSIIHILFDILKTIFVRGNPEKRGLFTLIIDQLIHLATIVLIIPLFSFNLTDGFLNIARKLSDYSGINLGQLPIERVIITLIVYLYIVFGGAVFMRKLFDYIYRNNTETVKRTFNAATNIENVKTGKVIGIFERIIVLTLFVTNNIASIAFVIAAKSLARFKNLSDKDFAEYYLIGTLASVLLAMLGGLILINFL
ncbi:MAG: DUF3307 domain-containing protein [Kosmotoga sp.]|nr:MAG: DUF3307 domain-containing protein [Kosmotoga sp.]